MITRENYEEYIMMYVDGELQPAQEKALLDFLALHPDLKKELDAYELTKLSPERSVTFAGKETLLKPLPAKHVVFFPQWIKYGIAAGIAAIFFLSVWHFQTTEKTSDVANTHQQQPTTVQPHEKEHTIQTQQATPTNIAAVIKSDTIVGIRRTRKPQKNFVVTSTTQHTKKSIVPIEHSTAPVVTTINKIDINTTNQLPYNKPETLPLTATEVPAYTVAVTAEEKKTFWDKLPIDDLKKKQLNNISADIKDGLDEKTLSIKIEKRKLILSF